MPEELPSLSTVERDAKKQYMQFQKKVYFCLINFWLIWKHTVQKELFQFQKMPLEW